MNEDKIYFMPGDLVTLKKDLPNKPIMMVVRAEKSIIKVNNSDNILKGIKCMWFRTDGSSEDRVFNTKDLIKV